jgi:hypothetical protein
MQILYGVTKLHAKTTVSGEALNVRCHFNGLSWHPPKGAEKTMSVTPFLKAIQLDTPAQ